MSALKGNKGIDISVQKEILAASATMRASVKSSTIDRRQKMTGKVLRKGKFP